MKKILSLLLALTLIFSMGTFMAQAETTEATGVTTVEPESLVSAASVKNIATSNGDLNSTKINAMFIDDNNEAFSTSSSNDNYYLNFSSGIGNMTNNTRTVNNTWFMIELSAAQTVSAIYLDLWKDRIREYEIYATSNETLATEIEAASAAKSGLSKKGEVYYDHKTDNSKDLICEGEGIIDKLVAENALVASGNLNGTGNVNTSKNTIVFDRVKSAKYIVFVVEGVPSNAQSSSVIIDEIRLLGASGKNETVIAQYPKTYPNYADKSVYSQVEACVSKGLTDSSDDKTTYGTPNALVDPAETAKPNGVSDPAFMLSNATAYKENSTFADTSTVSATPNSWIAIDFGAERTIDTVEIYQWKNRIKSVEVYALVDNGGTYGYTTAKANGSLNLSDGFYEKFTQYLGSASFDHGTSTSTELNVGSLDNPDVIDLGREVTCKGILIKVTAVQSVNNGVIIRRIMAKDYSKPEISYVNAYPENGIDYTVAFANDSTATKKYAVIEAQYNEAGEMIASNIKYVNVDPLYAKSFSGKITKVEGAKEIKVFSVCLNTIVPLETEYTFNVQ